ncbi:MAG: hypothetical protein JNM57_09575 [Cyclobacteriaceae bacterium]|nr:hypothetical protein [Cyclobacteriaceae bacterium]
MKRIMLLAMLFMVVGTSVRAQWGEETMDEKPSFKDRVFTGGGFGLSFSNYSDFFSVSPIIGYKLTDKLATGLMFQYRYTKYKTISPPVTANDFGVSPFLRYNFYGPLFLHAEYEYLNYQIVYSNGEKSRLGFNSFMAGGGLFQPIGRNAGLYIVALYNFSYKSPSASNYYYPYNSPMVLRVGITAGF